MISAEAGVMGSDNSNGSAHKHLAQFTLSNAPHGSTFSSCLSVYMVTKPKRAFKKKIPIYVHFFIFPHPIHSFGIESIFLFLQKKLDPQCLLPASIFCFTLPNVSFPSPSLYDNLDDFVSLFSHSCRSLSCCLTLPFHQASSSTH